MLRAVIFDFGGVLCFHPTDEQMAEAAHASGFTVPDFLNAFWSNRIAYDAGELDEYAYWTRMVSGDMVPAMVQREIGFWSHFDERILAWIGKLRAARMRTGILSNLPGPLGRHLRTSTRLLEHFDHVTFSYELGIVKPHAAIYEDMIRGLGIPAQESLFLDDRQENVAGARAVGLQAVQYVSWEDFALSGMVRFDLPAL